MIFYFKLIIRLIKDFFYPKELILDNDKFNTEILRHKIRSKFSSDKFPKVAWFFYKYLIKSKNLLDLKCIIHKARTFSLIYYLLEDNYSKNKTIELLSGYILGFRFVKLALNNSHYWKIRKDINRLAEENEIQKIGKWDLKIFNLSKNRIPIKLFSFPLNILNTFLLEQYCYKHDDSVCVKKGDYVLDAGGCWGDTALYFANKVGSSGKVYSFEFIPNNLNVFERNINLNTHLRKIIKIIKFPLWKSSNNYLFSIENGPNSKISFKALNNNSVKIKTISIDEYVRINNIKKIDFIKMDIEGAEFNALIGAKQVLTKYRPNLAISIYHNFDDFIEIPQFINSLNLNYKFYLDHFTTHNEETILFAKVN